MTAILILLTWLLWAGAFTGIGATLLALRGRDINVRKQLQGGLWLGIALAMLSLGAVQVFIGVGKEFGLYGSTAILVLGNLLLIRILVAQRVTIHQALIMSLSYRRLAALIVVVLLFIGLLDVAWLATGEPMDADAGSYRIGSILYAADYRVVPGLANLHFRFGFNSTLWPFAAFIGSGFWETQGYRIVTGLFITALFLDIVLRVLVPRAKGNLPGDWFLILAMGFLGAIIFTDAGRWVPSPAQDVVVYVLTVVSTAFLIDFLSHPAKGMWSATNAVLIAALAGSVRPLGWLFFILSISVIAVALKLSRVSWRAMVLSMRWPLAFSFTLAVVTIVRDFLLSGWALYPLGLISLPVPWRTIPGDSARDGITAYGRAPGIDMNEVLASNDWFIPWLETFLQSREVFFLRIMLIGALLPLLWPSGRRAWKVVWKPLSLALIPSLGTAIIWFITAPDLRFGWGAVLGSCAIPGALLLAANAYPKGVAKTLGVVAMVAFMATQVLNGRYEPRGADPVPLERQLGPVGVTIHLGPPPTPEAVSGRLGDGTEITFPAVGGNCYDIFPLCLIPNSGTGVRSLGDEIPDGFAVIGDNE